jgi:hypothetical protein
MSSRAALTAAVRVEDEIVYGYGVIGAHLGGARERFAARRLATHQQLRDRLESLGHTAVTAEPAYQLPFPVVDASSAAALAIQLEDGAAAAAYAVVAASDPDDAARRLGVDMLSDVGAAAARWRVISAATDGPAFPGQPVAASAASQPSTTPTTSPSSSTTASGSTS